MNIEEAIQNLQDIGHFLNHRLGTDSYEARCKIYDIRKMLIEQVEKTVVLADVSGQLADFLLWYNGKFEKETTADKIVEEYLKQKGG